MNDIQRSIIMKAIKIKMERDENLKLEDCLEEYSKLTKEDKEKIIALYNK